MCAAMRTENGRHTSMGHTVCWSNDYFRNELKLQPHELVKDTKCVKREPALYLLPAELWHIGYYILVMVKDTKGVKTEPALYLHN